MTMLQTLAYATIGTAVIAGVMWVAVRSFTRWLIGDLGAKRAVREHRIARAERAVRNKGNGKDQAWPDERYFAQE